MRGFNGTVSMNEWLKRVRWRDAAAPIFAVLCVMALLFRLPNFAMDFLLSLNLALSVSIFLSVFFARTPLEFSSFPTILLLSTLFRLVLNVSTTRLILIQGDAGQVISAFSRFVAGGNIVVGCVIFLIFIVIQFVVITKGATRISEVSARFTLDALPGRQSAIDFDLNAGNISEKEAKAARAELAEQADFFGAMDGASKFVRGDAIAGLVIVAVNLIGGFVIGTLQQGRSPAEAVELYSKLTIGDGLVSQIPAFLISLATGLLVARSSRKQNISETALRQTFGKPVVLSFSGVFLLLLTLTGLPVLPLIILALGCFTLAFAVRNQGDESSESQPEEGGDERITNEQKKDDDVDDYMRIDPIELEIGAGLIGVASPQNGPSLLERARSVRQKIASELGFALPKVRIRDSNALDENQYRVCVNGDEVAFGVVYPEMLLAVSGVYTTGTIHGLLTNAPDSSADAYWIEAAQARDAEIMGYEILTPGDAIERKLLDVSRREAPRLLTRDGAKRLVERLRAFSPSLVEEALGEQSSESSESRETAARLARIQTVLRLLLAERVSIRRLDAILEAINDLTLREPTANTYRILEYTRARLSRFLSAQYRNEDSEMFVVMFEPEAESALASSISTDSYGKPTLLLSPSDSQDLVEALAKSLDELQEMERPKVVLTDASIRFALRELTREGIPDAVFLAFDEVESGTKINQANVVNWLAKDAEETRARNK